MIIIPQKWLDVARKHKGIIAGGCLRDLVLGNMPPKDVDIWVEGLVQADVPPEATEEYIAGMFTVANVTQDGITYQIIRHNKGTMRQLVDGFDIGLCKLGYDPDLWFANPWYIHQDFVEDAVNHTLTIYRDDTPLHEKHLASVSAKYPDYKIIRDEGLEILF